MLVWVVYVKHPLGDGGGGREPNARPFSPSRRRAENWDGAEFSDTRGVNVISKSKYLREEKGE